MPRDLSRERRDGVGQRNVCRSACPRGSAERCSREAGAGAAFGSLSNRSARALRRWPPGRGGDSAKVSSLPVTPCASCPARSCGTSTKSRPLRVMNDTFVLGRMFGYGRSRAMGLAERLGRALLLPLIVAKNVQRCLGNARRLAATRSELLRAAAPTAVAASCFSIGEVVGYFDRKSVVGVGRIPRVPRARSPERATPGSDLACTGGRCTSGGCAMKHALVTGGSGLIGRYLIGLLLREGVSVRATVRDSSSAGQIAEPGVEVVRWSLDDEAVSPRLLDGIDTVFHLAAPRRVHDKADGMRGGPAGRSHGRLHTTGGSRRGKRRRLHGHEQQRRGLWETVGRSGRGGAGEPGKRLRA